MENKKYKVFIGPSLYRAKMVGQFDSATEANKALIAAAENMGHKVEPVWTMSYDRGCLICDFGSWHDFGYIFGDKLL